MIPYDSEFILLYLFYFAILAYFLFGYFTTKEKIYKISLIILLVYTFFMLYLFSNTENFKYGNSLAVLFYGGLLLIAQLFIFIVSILINKFNKNE